MNQERNHRKGTPTFVVVLGVAILGLGSLWMVRREVGSPTSLERPDRPAVETHRVSATHWVSRQDKEAYFKDIARVSGQITLRPIPGKDPDSVAELSILKDDRILKVNGTPVVTLGRAIILVHEIKSGHRLDVQVQRGEKIVDYRVDFE